MFTLRRTILILVSLFNFVCSIASIIAFFSVYPTLAMTYFFISLPITVYVLLAKPNKVLDTNLNNWTQKFADEKLASNPF